MGSAKTTRPAVARTLQRPRLSKLLDKSSSLPVTWVCGPPGSGKTTLVSSYVGGMGRSVTWFQCDRGDADLGTFFMYLAGSAPRRGPSLPAFGKEHSTGAEQFARQFFRKLFARWHAGRILVLDDFQAIGEAPLCDLLPILADEVPRANRVIIVSRTEPPSSLARHLLHGRLCVIDGVDLRFSTNEAKRLLGTIQGEQQATNDAQTVLDSADGWAAGLILLAAQPRMRPLQRARSEQALFDYFAREVVSMLDARARRILRATSLLPHFTDSDARALSGDDEAPALVEQLFNANYFTSRRRLQNEFVYEYHPLFRTYLSDTIPELFDPVSRRRLHLDAARLAEEKDELHVAFELYRAAAPAVDLPAFIIRRAPALLAQGRSQTIEEWYASVPEEGRHSGWLLYWRGLSDIGWDYVAGCRFLEEAFECFKADDDRDGMIAAAAALLALDQGAGRIGEMDRHGPLLDRLLRDSPVEPDTLPPLVVSAMFGYIAFRQFRRSDASLWSERALALCRTLPDLPLRGVLAVTWFQYCNSIALYGAVDTVVHDMRAIWRDTRLPPAARITAAATLALDAFHGGSRDYSVLIEEALQLAWDSGAFYAARHVVVGLGIFAAVADENEGAAGRWLQLYRDEFTRMEAGYRNWYHQLAARMALRQADATAAEYHRQEMFRYNFPGWIITDVSSFLVSAQVLAAQEKWSESRQALREALTQARQADAPLAVFMALTTDCELSLKATGTVDVSVLTEAMQIGADHGILNSYTWSREAIERLCVEALRHDIQREYAETLIRTHHLRPRSGTPPVAWPNQVVVRSLPDLVTLSLGPQTALQARKPQRKPLDLLKLLVAFGPKPVREERLADLLWPESSGDAAQFSLTTTIHRLRRLLASDEAIVRYDRGVSLSTEVCWVDVFRLREVLARLEQSRSLEDREMTAAFDEIERLYQGPLLAGVEEGGIPHERDALTRRVVTQLERMGEKWEMACRSEAAVRVYALAFHIDPSSENSCRRLMAHHVGNGVSAAARDVLTTCERALATRSRATLSAPTLSLARTLGLR